MFYEDDFKEYNLNDYFIDPIQINLELKIKVNLFAVIADAPASAKIIKKYILSEWILGKQLAYHRIYSMNNYPNIRKLASNFQINESIKNNTIKCGIKVQFCFQNIFICHFLHL